MAGMVMFSQACIRNSVHSGGEGGLCPSMHLRSHDQRGLCPWGFCPGGVSLFGGRVSVQRGVSVRETPFTAAERDPRRTVTSGRHASYWNVFLVAEDVD